MTAQANPVAEDAQSPGRPRDYRCYVAGEWYEPAGGQVDSISPATGAVIGRTPECDRHDAEIAVAAAAAAAEGFAAMTATERSALCHRVGEALEAHSDALAQLLTLDQGKPLNREAALEAKVCSAFFHLAAEDILRLNGETMHSGASTKRIFTHYTSRGPYAVITPWNFPYNIAAEHLSAHFAAGNPVVWVPSPAVASCSLAFAEALVEAEIPKGVFNVLTGAGNVVGDALVTNPSIAGVSLTGSSQTGDIVMKRAGAKPALLELGGNGPVIVLADADLEAAAAGIIFSAYFNAGQSCSATERVLVAREVHDDLLAMVAAATEQVVLDDPFGEATTMGPLNNDPVAKKMDSHIEDALSKGASLVKGGARAGGFPTNLYYQATVLDGVTPEMLVSQEETFGPIVPFLSVGGPDEALRLANADPSGLVASVYTKDLHLAMDFSQRLRSGVVVINETPDYWELHVPYGGAGGKRSGYGKLGGLNALRSVMDLHATIMEIG